MCKILAPLSTAYRDYSVIYTIDLPGSKFFMEYCIGFNCYIPFNKDIDLTTRNIPYSKEVIKQMIECIEDV